jgi:hypothetical protein
MGHVLLFIECTNTNLFQVVDFFPLILRHLNLVVKKELARFVLLAILIGNHY